jgi:hypothetical protein
LILRRGRDRVDEDELVAKVAGHQLADRQFEIATAVAGVNGDRAVRRQHGSVEGGVRGGRDLHDDVDAFGRETADLVEGIAAAVIDDMLSAGSERELRLLVAADGGDHARSCPARELNCGVADRARTAGNQHRLSSERSSRESARPQL